MNEQTGFSQDKPDHYYRTEIPNCIDDAELDHFEYRIYAHIKRIAGDAGICFKSVKSIATHCKISERKVNDVLAKLCQVNEFLGLPLLTKIIRQKPDGSFETCIYHIVDVWHLNKKFYRKTVGGGGAPDALGVVHGVHYPGAPRAEEEEPFKKNPFKKEEDERRRSSSSIKIDKKAKKFEGLTEEMLKIWKDTFPNLDLIAELKQCFAKAYLQKERADWTSFILSWLQNSQKRAIDNPIEVLTDPSEKNKDMAKEFVKSCKNAEWELRILKDRIECIKKNGKRIEVILFDSVYFNNEFNKLTKIIGK